MYAAGAHQARGGSGSLVVGFSVLDRMCRDLFPGLVAAYHGWRAGYRGRALPTAIAAGAAQWRGACERTIEALFASAENRL